jgi:LysR family hydrogen peroxide-inducible transcriptional activator
MQIQKLELELGVVIFDRSKKPIILTSAGQKIIDQIKTVLFEAQKIESLLEVNDKEPQSGELTMGVIPTIAPYILPRLLPILEKHYSKLRLKIFEMQTEDIITSLENDEINVGLLATPLKINKIHEFPLYFEPFHVFCQKTHPLARQKKLKYSALDYSDIWLLEEGHCLRHQVLDICPPKRKQAEKKEPQQVQFESGSLETLKNIVTSYGGFTLLPQLATEQIHDTSTIVSFERPIPAREVGLVYQRAHYKNDLIELLGAAILKSIPSEISKIRRKDLDVLEVGDF